MIPYVVQYCNDSFPEAYKLKQFMTISKGWNLYSYRYYLYNCVVYGFNPASTVFKSQKRWKLFNNEIPAELI